MSDCYFYTEEEIRKAILKLNEKYTGEAEKMSFHDMLLIENILMNIEMFLFNGDIREETIDIKDNVCREYVRFIKIKDGCYWEKILDKEQNKILENIDETVDLLNILNKSSCFGDVPIITFNKDAYENDKLKNEVKELQKKIEDLEEELEMERITGMNTGFKADDFHRELCRTRDELGKLRFEYGGLKVKYDGLLKRCEEK